MDYSLCVTTADWIKPLDAQLRRYKADAALTGLGGMDAYGVQPGMTCWELRKALLGLDPRPRYVFFLGDTPAFIYSGNESGHWYERTVTDHVMLTVEEPVADPSAPDQVVWWTPCNPYAASGRLVTSQIPARQFDPKNPRSPLQMASDYLDKLHLHETLKNKTVEHRVASVDHFYDDKIIAMRREFQALASVMETHDWPIDKVSGWDGFMAAQQGRSALAYLMASGGMLNGDQGWFYFLCPTAADWIQREPNVKIVVGEASLFNNIYSRNNPPMVMLTGPNVMGVLHAGISSQGVHVIAQPGGRLGDVGIDMASNGNTMPNSPLRQMVYGEPRVMLMDPRTVAVQGAMDRLGVAEPQLLKVAADRNVSISLATGSA